MADQVELSVRSQLQKVIDELAKIQKKADETGTTIGKMGKAVGEGVDNQVKKTGEGVSKMASLTRRLLDTLKSDLKSLASINALQESLRMSNMFKDSIKETLSLGDAIRRLGPTLGIASKDFASFQNTFIKGMGDIGLSSEAATKALEGLAETPVRGEKNLLEYAKTAGMLASISNQKGSEGGIAGGISGLIQARGGNVNDMGQMKSVAEDLRRVQIATGMGAAQTIGKMQSMFTSMSADFRKSFSTRQLAELAAGAHAAGPNATAFVEAYLKMSKTQRSGLEARGVGGLVGKDGLDTENIKKFYEEAKRLGSGDIRLGLKAMGVEGDEAAEGFVRLAEHLKEVAAAQNEVARASGDLNKQYHESMGLTESFKANINKVKSLFAPAISGVGQKATEFLQHTSESKLGAGAVVAGGGLLAATLAGGGLRGLGKGMFGGAVGMAKDEAKYEAYSAVTGEKVNKVWVVNFPEDEGGGHGGGAMGALGKVGMVGGAAAAGVGLGMLANKVIEAKTQGTTDEGFQGNAVERMFFKIDKLMGGDKSKAIIGANKVTIELNEKQLKYSKQPTRGASQ